MIRTPTAAFEAAAAGCIFGDAVMVESAEYWFKRGYASRAKTSAVDRLTPVERELFGFKPRVYISGPMSNLPDLNRPAFNAEAARLRALGHQVENPAEVALPDGATWEDYMRVDIPLLLTCTHIRMLDGWTMSKGARLEHHIAVALGLTVIEVGEVVA